MRRNLYRVSLKQVKKRLAQQFNFTYRFINDVLSLNNSKCQEYLEFMYPPELEIKESTETTTAATYSCTWIVISALTMESSLLGFTTNWMTSTFPQ